MFSNWLCCYLYKDGKNVNSTLVSFEKKSHNSQAENKMIFEIFLFVLSGVSLTLTQQMMCTYTQSTDNFSRYKYQCDLFVYNPDGLNNSVSIRGNHFTSYTDANVLSVKGSAGVTKNIPSSICSQFPNVDVLYFQQMNIEIMSIQNCSRASTIFLSYNAIKELPSNLCYNQPLISSLYLSFNQIQVIASDALNSCTKLQTFNVDNNQLSEISPTLFVNKPALKVVSFGNNKKITTVQDYTFIGAFNLETLTLSGCAINNISPNAFAGLRKLKYLELSNNALTTINPQWFSELVSLTSLLISRNPLATIQSNAFKPLISLEVLSLSDLGITTLNPEWFTTLTRLTKLELTSNAIREIPPGIFNSCIQLQQIYISGNKLQRIDSKPFSAQGLQALDLINLSGNQISAVEKLLFDGPIKLNIIGFWGNLCDSRNIYSFFENKNINLEYFQTCFLNYDASVV